MFEKEFIDAFSVFDSKKEGQIAVEEIVEQFSQWKSPLSKTMIGSMVRHCDQDQSGFIDLHEFRQLWTFLRQQVADDEMLEIVEEFRRFDKDGDGCITRNEMLEVLTACKHVRAELMVEAIKCVQELDLDGNENITFPEFLIAYKFRG